MGSWFVCKFKEDTKCDKCDGCDYCGNCKHWDSDEPGGDDFYCGHCNNNPRFDDRNNNNY